VVLFFLPFTSSCVLLASGCGLGTVWWVTEVLKIAAGCEGHGWNIGCRQGFCQFCGFEKFGNFFQHLSNFSWFYTNRTKFSQHENYPWKKTLIVGARWWCSGIFVFEVLLEPACSWVGNLLVWYVWRSIKVPKKMLKRFASFCGKKWLYLQWYFWLAFRFWSIHQPCHDDQGYLNVSCFEQQV